mgnify:FL=1
MKETVRLEAMPEMQKALVLVSQLSFCCTAAGGSGGGEEPMAPTFGVFFGVLDWEVGARSG